MRLALIRVARQHENGNKAWKIILPSVDQVWPVRKETNEWHDEQVSIILGIEWGEQLIITEKAEMKSSLESMVLM